MVLKERYTEDICKNFHACCLTLATDPSLEALPTDERLRRAAAQPDPGLDALYFQYGRWLLFAASRPGSLPANLQGVWNDSFFPPWDSKYTININTEMNYWMTGPCRLQTVSMSSAAAFFSTACTSTPYLPTMPMK